MKQKTLRRSVVLLTIAFLFGGCATSGYKRASETRSAIETAKLSVMKLQQETDAAVLALTNITALPTGDLRPQYESLVAAVKNLEQETHRLPRRAASVDRKRRAYFHTWTGELAKFDSPAIRSESAQRRDEVVRSFQKIGAEFQAAEQALHPLFLHLQDMVRHLGTDLTASGVAVVKDEADRIVQDAQDTQKQLASLLAELERLSEELSPVIPAGETTVK